MDALIDEMYDGFDEKINDFNLKCKAYSIKKLIADGKQLKTDYSVINYAKDNGMVLIIADVESSKGCEENDIPCILISQNSILDTMVEQLKKYC